MHYYIGAWRALKEVNYTDKITSLGGGSSGSLTAFLLAAGVDHDTIDKKICEYTLMYPNIHCWGKMSKIVGDTIDEWILNSNDQWKYQPYAVITNIQNNIPFIGPRFIISPERYNNFDNIKNLILSSCYIPFWYEKVPKWQNRFALDGGVFLMNLTIPNTLTISPYMQMQHNIIGYEQNTEEEKILKKRKFASLLPNKEHLLQIRDCGYTNAKNWLIKYNS
jgi:hypothetical protein